MPSADARLVDPHAGRESSDLTDRGPLQEIVELLGRREAIYRESADFQVDTEGKTPEQLTDEILDRLRPTFDAGTST